MPQETKTPGENWLRWIAAGAVAVAGAMFLDGPLDPLLQVHAHPAVQQFAHDLSAIGDWWPAAIAGAALCGIFLWRRRAETARIVLAVTLTGMASGLTGTIIRSLTGRTRPSAEVAQGFYGVWRDGHCIIGQYPFMSFPSGHASTLIGLAAAAWMANRRAGAVLGIFAALVSWSRVAQSCHHISDIVAAAVVGVMFGKFIFPRLDRKLQPAFDHLQKKSGYARSGGKFTRSPTV